MKKISTIDSISNEFNQSQENTLNKITNIINQLFNIKDNHIYNKEELLKFIKNDLEKEENYLSDLVMLREDIKVNYFIEFVQSLDYLDNNFNQEYLEYIQSSLFEISETLQLNLDVINQKHKNSPKFYSLVHDVKDLDNNLQSSIFSIFTFKPEHLVKNEDNSFNYEPNMFSPNNIKSTIVYYLKVEIENNIELLTDKNVTSFPHQLIKALIQYSAQDTLSHNFNQNFKNIYSFIEDNKEESHSLNFKNKLTSKIIKELELQDLSLETSFYNLDILNNKRKNKR